MTDLAALVALGLTAVIQLGACAYVYGKLTQRVGDHNTQLSRLWQRTDDHSRDIERTKVTIDDHERRIGRLEER